MNLKMINSIHMKTSKKSIQPDKSIGSVIALSSSADPLYGETVIHVDVMQN